MVGTSRSQRLASPPNPACGCATTPGIRISQSANGYDSANHPSTDGVTLAGDARFTQW